jgi:hypothetical protein
VEEAVEVMVLVAVQVVAVLLEYLVMVEMVKQILVAEEAVPMTKVVEYLEQVVVVALVS